MAQRKVNQLYDLEGIRKILLIIWRTSKRYTIYRIITVIFLAILPLIPLYLLKLLLDHFSNAGNEISTKYLMGLLIAFAIVAVLRILISNLSQYISLLQSDLIQDKMASILISKSIKIDLEYFDSDSYHDIFQRALAQGGRIPLAVFSSLITLVQNVITLLAIGAILITLHWSVTIILFFIALPVAFIRYKYSEKTVALRVKQTQEERKAGYINRVLTNTEYAKEVRVFNFGQYLLDQFLKLKFVLRKEKRELYKRQLAAVSLTQTAESVAIIGALAIIIMKAVKGLLTVGDIALYYTAFQKGQTSINAMLKSLVMIHENRLYINHIFEFLDLEEKVREPSVPQTMVSKINSFQVKNVSFTYPGTTKEVVKNISVEFEAGKIYAIVGENGSGKTTLVKLINRLYEPTSGELLINNQINIKDFSLGELRNKMTVIFQYFAKYNFSIKENIGLSDIDVDMSEAEISKAAELSNASKFIEKFDKKLNTKLGRSFKLGQELSGGQWQKIALARAFYKKADLIVLDEPTSFIDPLSEDAIFNNLRDVGADKILILITHRIYNLKSVDKIIVMDDGKIVEFGDHQSLLQQNGLYKSMFEKQDV